MATLMGDIRVWSLREDVVVRDADFSAVRYQDKSSVSKERVYYEEKKRYIEARGGCVVPKNSRPTRLRDTIKEFEELVSAERVVWCGWRQQQKQQHQHAGVAVGSGMEDEPCRVYQMVLASGVVCTAVVSAITGDLRQLSSDKYLTGKLLTDHPAHAAITHNHLIISYNDSRLTVLHLDGYNFPTTYPLAGQGDPSNPAGGSSSAVPPLMATRHPSLYTTQLAGPHGRRFQRKLSANITGDMVLVWWERSEDEVYPWSPIERDRRDRANILVYGLYCGQLSLLCHARSHLPPLSVAFSARDASVVLSVEQGFDKKGGVTVLSCVYKIEGSSMDRVSVTSIPLEAPVASHSYSPMEDRLVLACNNGVLALHSHSSTHLTRAALSPTHVSWLQPGAVLAVANDRGQVQCFDMALSLLRIQLGGEDGLPVRLLDLADYFCHQPSLCTVSWAPAPVVLSGGDAATGSDEQDLDLTEQYSSLLLMLHYSRGPLTCLRFNAPHFSLTHPVTNFKSDDLNSSSVSSDIKSHTSSSDPHNCTTTSNSSSSSCSNSASAAANSPNTSADSTEKPPTLCRPETSHFCSISPDVLVGEYLCHGQVEEAVNLCSSLCWEQDGGVALKCASCVVNYIIRRGQLGGSSDAGAMDGSPGGSSGATKTSAGGSDAGSSQDTRPATAASTVSDSTALGAGVWESRVLGAAGVLSSGFLSPSTPLSTATEELYGPAVRALARRLFFKLLRCGCLQSAYTLACDLGDPDCFLRLHRSAQRRGLVQLAGDAMQRAESLRCTSSCSSSSCCSDSCDSGSGSSYCSENCDNEDHSHSSGSSCSSTCSTCSETSSGSGSEGEEGDRPPRGVTPGRSCLEVDGNANVESAIAASDDPKMRQPRPLLVEQSPSAPPPAPILPPTTTTTTTTAAQHQASTLTYYDPVTPTGGNYSNNGVSCNTFSSNAGDSALFAAVNAASSDSYEPVMFSNARRTQQATCMESSPGNFLVHSEANHLKSSAEHFVSSQYSDQHTNSKSLEKYSSFEADPTAALGDQYRHAMQTSDCMQTAASLSAVAASPLTSVDAPVSAITSQDGKVTINITGDSSHRPHHRSSHRGHTRRSANGDCSHGSSHHQHTHSQQGMHDSSSVRQDMKIAPDASPAKDFSLKKKPASGPFANRRSQRNFAEAMDAADSAIAAIQSAKVIGGNNSDQNSQSNNRNSSKHKHSHSKQSTPEKHEVINVSVEQNSYVDHKGVIVDSNKWNDASNQEKSGRVSYSSRYHASKLQQEDKQPRLESSQQTAAVQESAPIQNCAVPAAAVQNSAVPAAVVQNSAPAAVVTQDRAATGGGQHPTLLKGVGHSKPPPPPKPLHYRPDYYQDHEYYNEESIDEELDRSIYQELSTEEEEGGTVKVVHFGVV